MGRVVYETPHVAATMVGRGGRPDVVGEAFCRVRVMTPDENAFGPDFEGSMRRLRPRLAPDGSLSAPAPAPMLRAPNATIPREVFDGLPDAALVSFHWEFHVTGACTLPPKPD
jgi:hypothetical protein